MTVDITKFRTDFPEFNYPTRYPDPQVQFYLDLAQGNSNGLQGFIGPRWGTKADYGTELFVAHNLTLESEAQKLSAKGQNPGQILGPLTSAGVDKVSYTRDLHNILLPDAGHWNLSVYGLRYLQLARLIGAGPVMVSPSGAGPGCAGGGVYPWAGPMFPPNYP
jgi:hypothetical protein